LQKAAVSSKVSGAALIIILFEPKLSTIIVMHRIAIFVFEVPCAGFAGLQRVVSESLIGSITMRGRDEQPARLLSKC
jgi:hypothetical protein